MDTTTSLLVLAGFAFSAIFGLSLGWLLQEYGHFRQPQAPMARLMAGSRATPADAYVAVAAAQLRAARRRTQSAEVAARALALQFADTRPHTVLIRAPQHRQ